MKLTIQGKLALALYVVLISAVVFIPDPQVTAAARVFVVAVFTLLTVGFFTL